MSNESDRSEFFVLTGGPGTGKTTVMEVLRRRGFTCLDDAARSVIRERRRDGLSPRPEPAEFAREVLARELVSWNAARMDVGPVFFERGVVDAVGMAQNTGVLDDREASDLVARHRYRPPVFLFPPWEEIFVHDAERDQDFAHVERVHVGVRRLYEKYGYEVVEVQRAAPERRAAIIVERVLATLGDNA